MIRGRDRAAAPQRARFIVGARVRWVVATFPFARLSATPERLVVSAVIRRAVIERSHTECVYTKRLLWRTMILFDTDDQSGDWILVYPWGLRRILRTLAMLGWPVVG